MCEEISLGCSNWWASVKYKNFDEKEYVQISKISVEDELGNRFPFRPKDFNDFDRNKFYCIKTSQNSKDKKESLYYGNIGRMAVSKGALKSSTKRSRWPIVTRCDREPLSSEDEAARRLSLRGPQLVRNSRDQNKLAAASKKSAQDENYTNFINRHIRDFNFLDSRNNPNILQDSPQSLDSPEINLLREQETSNSKIAQLEQRLAALENRDKSTAINTETLIKFLDEKFKSFESKLDLKLRQYVDQNMEVLNQVREEIANLKEVFCKLPDQKNIQEWLNNLPI